ncbi:uncharacterized protein LOC132551146 [Ylistrum balloti]|uniref:uncharacterized protein LOC132551146 n=1 Tax=Ylistrum balloti TaxID=509963 RepID=UPI002905D784|nr:uncharacterized protein LOC132551146 [Ylistrum balloti]
MKMRSSGGKVQESSFCDILHNAVLQVCREKYWADSPDWEVDGVICVSVPHSQEQHVVKIHQKFPSNSSKHFDNRCYECERKPKDALSTNETSDRHFSESVEEDDSSYRNVSVIDLEHASTQPNPAQTCGQGTIPPSMPSPVRDHDQNSHNFYASPDLSGFGPNVHRQKNEQLKNSSGQSHSKSNSRTKDQEHSSSITTSHPRETTPPRKKSKTDQEEYVVVKAEPDDDEDFALHMECIDEKESDNIVEIKDENTHRDLAAETQEDINFLLNVEGPGASHQYNSGDRSWPPRLPTNTVTSQMDTNLSSIAGQGSQGFSNLNLLTHGVDIEDGTMRLTTRVQHPSFIAGQTDSNTPEQRTIPRPSGQDSAAASNTIGKINQSLSFFQNTFTDTPRAEGNVEMAVEGTTSSGPIFNPRSAGNVEMAVRGTTSTGSVPAKNVQAIARKRLQLNRARIGLGIKSTAGLLLDKKFFCKFCGLGFTNCGNKNRHERTTCGATVYKCNMCSSVFSRTDSRARHMLAHHGVSIRG